jgi:uncharacterized phage-associated protein
MSRAFQFYPERAVEAAAFLLRRERGHRMNYMRLLKILYIAEREILEETGMPLTGSRVVAMQRGPVLEDVLHLIRGQHSATDKWAEFLQIDRYNVELIRDPGVNLLSRYVSRKLEEIAVRYQEFDEWQLVEETHKFPEWKKNDPGQSSQEIPLIDILEAIGRADDLPQIVSDAREQAAARSFFSEAKPVSGV